MKEVVGGDGPSQNYQPTFSSHSQLSSALFPAAAKPLNTHRKKN